MKNTIGWLALAAALISSDAGRAENPTSDLVTELTDARRVFVPVEDLDVIIERDKTGVLLPRAKFDVLLTQARANAEKNAVPEGVAVVLSRAEYDAQIVGDQLLMTVTAELTQFDDDWHESRFALQRSSLEQALVDDVPAMIGRHPDGSVSLFTESRGQHIIKLQLSTELTAMGSDLVAAFSLLRAPSGSFHLSLPAGKRLLIGNLQIERPAALDQVADYHINVGGAGGLQLRVTDRAAENSADSLTFASTGYGLHVAPGEVTWHAVTSLQVFGQPIDRLSVSVPRRLEIASVEATGLERWELSDDPEDAQRTNVSLTFGQAFEGTRKIAFQGVMAVEAGESWSVPPLRIENVTSHVGQIVVQYPTGIRLRIEETAGVRRVTNTQHDKPHSSDLPHNTAASDSIRFDVWQPEFLLQLSTLPKELVVHSAVAAVLDVNATGLDLQAAFTVESHIASLFELDIRLPADWQVVHAARENQQLNWQLIPLEEPGINQLRIVLDPPLAADSTGQIRLSIRRDVDGWPVESEPVVVDLPELFLPQSSLSEGALVVRGDDDLEFEALDLAGLDPYPLKAAYERLRFQSQDTRYSGKLKITRKPSRVAAQVVTFSRIDPQTFHTFTQCVVEVQGGGVRSLKAALPESAGLGVRFVAHGVRLVEQQPLAVQNGERIWELKFDQRLRGQTFIHFELEVPRDQDVEFIVPQCRIVSAERQNGFVAVEAAGEQRLTMKAFDADNEPLAEVDTLALPQIYYQPKERIVAVFRTVSAGATVTLSEQKFDKLPVPTAVCPLLEISSILAASGEMQHRATFELDFVGIQGLHVTLPNQSTLWATLVNGQPVEVRRRGDVYLIPLSSLVPSAPAGISSPAVPPDPQVRAHGGIEHRTLQLFYRSDVASQPHLSSLAQHPPHLSVETGQRTALPVEILKQTWMLHYPEETRVIDSHSPMEPIQALDRTSLLLTWDSIRQLPSADQLRQHLLILFGTLAVIILIITIARRRKRLTVILGIVSLLLGGVLFTLLAPAIQPARRAYLKHSQPMAEAEFHSPATRALAESEPPKPMGPQMQPGFKGGFEHQLSPEDKASSALQTVNDMEFPFSMQDPRFGKVATAPPAPDAAAVVGLAAPVQHVPQQAGPPAHPARTGSQSPAGAALLSLVIDFAPPAGSRQKHFQYIGADNPASGIPLEIDYVDRRSLGSFRVFLIALLVMIGWMIRKIPLARKAGLATIGIALPLALMPLVPVRWQPVLDGVLLGTMVVLLIWLVCGIIKGIYHLLARIHGLTTVTPVSVALFLILSSIGVAGEGETPVVEQSVTAQTSSRLIIPFDAGTEPLASERVFLSHDQFVRLYRLANPDTVSKNPAPHAGGIYEALYAAKLLPNADHPDLATLDVAAKYTVKSQTDGQLIVDLPIGKVAARSAKLDGQDAALVSGENGFQVAIPAAGLHVIDFQFEVPARLSGSTGSFSIPLLPVPAGRFAFTLPEPDLAIRVNGSSTIFRRVTQAAIQTIEFPIDKGGELSMAWQPKQAQGAANAVIHVDSVQAVSLTDFGANVSHGFSYRVRQGGIADTQFALPAALKLQGVTGPDVGGWEIQGEGEQRRLRIIFRRNVTDQTQLNVETFLETRIDSDSALISIPQMAPQEITNEIGQVVVFAGNQFSVRAEQSDRLTQIDGDKFATQVPITRPPFAPQLAYRFSKRPYELTLRVARQESQAHVTAEQAALISLRKHHLTTLLRYNLSGALRSSVSILLPEKFVLLDVKASGLRDFYVTRQFDEEVLTIELTEPRLGMLDVVVSGFTPRDTANSSIVFPQPIAPHRLDTTAAIWLDQGFTATLESFEGWRSTDPSLVSGELLAVRPAASPQFAFRATNLELSPLALSVIQKSPELTANGLSMVTVTDIAVVHLLALQWQIDAARTDTLQLTTPDWLAGKLDFQGEGIRDTTSADAGNNRTLWTIHLRTPISGRYFATATATFPPATTEVAAPAVAFELHQQPLPRQQQYVLLINSSLSQLTAIDRMLTDPVQREDVPVVVNQEFIDQATEFVRVKELYTAPKWTLHKFAQQSGAPASVNIADLTTILDRDGTYRAYAIYTIKNRTRQFLALKMPPGDELLSVFVADQPSRAVTTKLASLKGESVQLIALPKTSAASLSFPVKITWRGNLGRPLPKSARLTSVEFPIPAPQILSQQDDPEFGIPVARTRWTVYFPDDLDASGARSPSKHNLTLSSATEDPYGSAILQEAGELLGYFEQIRENNRRVKTRNNLKQIDVTVNNLKTLGRALSSFSSSGDSSEFDSSKADVMKRLKEVEQAATEENQKTIRYLTDSANFGMQNGTTTFQTEGLAEGAAIANGIQNSLILSNTISRVDDPITLKPMDEVFTFDVKRDGLPNRPATKGDDQRKNEEKGVGPTASTTQSGDAVNSSGNRSQLRMSNDANLDYLNSEVSKNNWHRQSQSNKSANGPSNSPAEPQSGVSIDGMISDGSSMNQNGNDSPAKQNNSLWNDNNTDKWSASQLPGTSTPYPRRDGEFPEGGIGGAGNSIREFRVGTPVDSPPSSQSPNGITPDNSHFGLAQQQQGAGGAMQLAGPMDPAQGIAAGQNYPGGLSLPINLPRSGRSLVFTKAGGDPKLTLMIQPLQSVQKAVNIVWSGAWLAMIAIVLLNLRQRTSLLRVLRVISIVFSILGAIGFCVLSAPLSWLGFTLFFVAAFVALLLRPSRLKSAPQV